LHGYLQHLSLAQSLRSRGNTALLDGTEDARRLRGFDWRVPRRAVCCLRNVEQIFACSGFGHYNLNMSNYIGTAGTSAELLTSLSRDSDSLPTSVSVVTSECDSRPSPQVPMSQFNTTPGAIGNPGMFRCSNDTSCFSPKADNPVMG
jgi:hypothetical protein